MDLLRILKSVRIIILLLVVLYMLASGSMSSNDAMSFLYKIDGSFDLYEPIENRQMNVNKEGGIN